MTLIEEHEKQPRKETLSSLQPEPYGIQIALWGVVGPRFSECAERLISTSLPGLGLTPSLP